MIKQKNRPHQPCYIHEKKCKYVCTFSKCEDRIICKKCLSEHLMQHPRQFLYGIDQITELHSIDKVDKMREMIAHNKQDEEQNIRSFYAQFNGILDPLAKRIQIYESQSRKMISEQLAHYLSTNKKIVQQTTIIKSDTRKMKDNPHKLVEEAVEEAQIISKRQNLLIQNKQKYVWYRDATQELCVSAISQMKSMIKVALTLFDNYTQMQASRFTEMQIPQQDHHQQSFYARYANSHKVAEKANLNQLQLAIIESKRQVEVKDNQIKRAQQQIKKKVQKIEEMDAIVNVLKKQIIQWQKKLQREEQEKYHAEGIERKRNQQFLIKLGVIGDNNQKIILEKKEIIDDKYLYVLTEMIPEPIELDLSQHRLNDQQLHYLLKFSTVEILKMNFLPVNVPYLRQAFYHFRLLHTLQLNSVGINDEILGDLSLHFPPKIKHLHLIDNQINDQGLEKMFKGMRNFNVESLFVSYNNLGPRSLQIIRNYAYNLKVLHISKNLIKSKGAVIIGKYLKQIRELFIGGTGVQKEGLLSLCRNSHKLKRLNLVGTELSTQIISQILLGMPNLEWLDISYTNLTQNDMQKIEKMKIFNKNLEIVANL